MKFVLFLTFIFLSCASTMDPLDRCIKLDKKIQKEIKNHPEKKDSLDHIRDSLWENY